MWFMPTYGRPHALDKLLSAPGGLPPLDQITTIYTADDPCLAEYLARWPFKHFIAPAGSRLGDIYRLILEKFPNETSYGSINDDHYPVTPGWWSMMDAAASDRYIAICNCPPRGMSVIGGIYTVGGGLARAMGTFVPNGLKHNYLDNFIEMIGSDFDLVRTVPDATVIHNHPELDPSVPSDATYKRGSHDRDEDRQRFSQWTGSDDRKAMADRIADFLGVKITAMDMSGVRLNICVPLHDWKHEWIFDQSMAQSLNLLRGYKVQVNINKVGGGSHIGKARERLLWNAMRTDCTHIMMVDSDMGWEPRVPLHLIASDHDFAAAVGVKKIDDPTPQFCCNFFPGEQQFDPRTNFLRVPEVGFGLVVIKREVIERMCAAYPELEYETDREDGVREFALFLDMMDKTAEGRRMRLSEDLSFCRRWTKIGGDIHVDHQIALIHVGRKEYTGRIADIFQINPKLAQAAE